MRIRHLLSFAAFAGIVAFAVSYIAGLGVRIGPPDNRIDITMRVPDINGLVVDSNVLLRGVPVGKVTGIETSVGGAAIHFYIDNRYSIPVDSEVKLENLSALGESYIGLMPRTASGPMFHDGQQVDTENITQPASISELATSVVRVLDQLDPVRLNRLVDESDRALPDPDAVLPNLARASTLLRTAVTDMNGRGAQVLKNFETLLQNAGWVGPTMAKINPALMALGTPLNGMLTAAFHLVIDSGAPESVKNFGRLMARVQHFLDTRAPDLKVFADAFTPNIKAVAAAAMNFDTGQILANMLNAIPEDGTITLRVRTPAR